MVYVRIYDGADDKYNIYHAILGNTVYFIKNTVV